MKFDVSTIYRFFTERPVYSLNRIEFIKENKNILLSAALLYVVALVFRSWPHYVHPAFYAEDASYYLKLNYHAGFSLADVFRNPNGYYNIFNNFISQVIGNIDIRLQPYAYHLVATTLTVTTVIMFSRSGLVKNRFLLLVTPLFIGLSGFNHIHYYTTITFQMYVLVITLLLILLWEKQHSFRGNLFIFLLIPLLIWSGPYSVLAVPFGLMFIFFFRGKTLVMLWAMILVLVYVSSTTGAAGSSLILDHIFSGFYQKLWFQTVVGDILYMGLRDNPNLEKALLLIAVLAPMIYLIRRDSLHLRILCILMAIIICTPAPLLLSNKYYLYQGVYPCHIVTAQISWVLFILILLDRVLLRVPVRYHSGAGISLLAVIVVFVIADNVIHPRKGRHEILTNIPEFTRTIKEYELQRDELEAKNQNVFIEAEGVAIFDPAVNVGSTRPDAKTIKRVVIPADAGL